MNCSYCGSSSTRRLETIYQEQTYQIQTTGIATSFSFQHGITNHRLSSRGKASSYLAQKVAPPKKKTAGWILALILAVFFVGLPLNTSIIRNTTNKILPKPAIDNIVLLSNLALLFGVIPGIAIICGRRVWHYNHEVYPQKLRIWLSSWHCDKCGSISVISS